MKTIRLFSRPFAKARDLLTDQTGPLLPYVLRGGLVSCLPVVALATITYWTGLQPADAFPIPRWPVPDPQLALALGVIDVLVLSPLAETGLVFVPIWILRKFKFRETLIPIVCALFFGWLHTRGGNWFALILAWPFYCYTWVLLAHEKRSIDRAWLIASAMHGVTNVVGLSASAALSLVAR